VGYLEYDAYPEMAERVMRQLAEEAKERFELEDCAVLHRTGRLEIGETSLLVAVASGHRAESFEAGHWLVNQIKKQVPVWKEGSVGRRRGMDRGARIHGHAAGPGRHARGPVGNDVQSSALV
jgi:molybdopterin synthase catalytic subunit